VVKFYITNISLWKQGNQVYISPIQHHLINLETNNTIDLNIPQQTGYDTIQFFIGTDSITNTSGAMAGDLDAMHGMYWAWQSGYINIKIEGASSICKTRKNVFQYHLGGYLSPNQTRQQVKLATTKQHININININITIPFDEILQRQTLQNTPEVMSPGTQAVINIQRFKQALKPIE
ncbi:MAG: MbnP family protein, partial [Bacteroidia bacterium]